MRTVKRALIGGQILTLLIGLTTLGSGCGDSSSTNPGGGVTAEEQVKKTQDAAGAMEAAGKAQKAAAKKK